MNVCEKREKHYAPTKFPKDMCDLAVLRSMLNARSGGGRIRWNGCSRGDRGKHCAPSTVSDIGNQAEEIENRSRGGREGNERIKVVGGGRSKGGGEKKKQREAKERGMGEKKRYE